MRNMAVNAEASGDEKWAGLHESKEKWVDSEEETDYSK